MIRMIFACLFTMVISTTAMAQNYNIPKASVVPVLNGVLLAGEWSDALVIPIAYPAILIGGGAIAGSAPANNNDLSATWYIKWDSANLYIACQVLDQSLSWDANPADGLNGGDCAQFGLNLFKNPNKASLPLHDFAPRTASATVPCIFTRADSLPNAKIGGSVTANGYIVEVSIPWSDYQYQALPGDRHGIALVQTDYDSGTFARCLADGGMGDWAAIFTAPFSIWNTMTLVDTNGCGQKGRSIADLNGDCRVDIKDFAKMAETWLRSIN